MNNSYFVKLINTTSVGGLIQINKELEISGLNIINLELTDHLETVKGSFLSFRFVRQFNYYGVLYKASTIDKLPDNHRDKLRSFYINFSCDICNIKGFVNGKDYKCSFDTFYYSEYYLEIYNQFVLNNFAMYLRDNENYLKMITL